MQQQIEENLYTTSMVLCTVKYHCTSTSNRDVVILRPCVSEVSEHSCLILQARTQHDLLGKQGHSEWSLDLNFDVGVRVNILWYDAMGRH